MGGFAGMPHFDVLHFSRRHWKDKFPSLRLATLEKEILGVHRSDDVPGQMVRNSMKPISAPAIAGRLYLL